MLIENKYIYTFMLFYNNISSSHLSIFNLVLSFYIYFIKKFYYILLIVLHNFIHDWTQQI